MIPVTRSKGYGLCLSKKTWDKLTPDQQKTVMEAARKVADEQVKLNRENLSKSYAGMAKSGVHVIEATPSW